MKTQAKTSLRRRYSNARRGGFDLVRECTCRNPKPRLAGGYWWLATVCMRCRRRAREAWPGDVPSRRGGAADGTT